MMVDDVVALLWSQDHRHHVTSQKRGVPFPRSRPPPLSHDFDFAKSDSNLRGSEFADWYQRKSGFSDGDHRCVTSVLKIGPTKCSVWPICGRSNERDEIMETHMPTILFMRDDQVQ